jgi:tetratricopeptide (TPR) repeat protein
MNLQPKKHHILIIVSLAATFVHTELRAQVLAPATPANKFPALSDEQIRQGHYGQAAQSANTYNSLQNSKVALSNPSDGEKTKFNKAMAGLKTNASEAPLYAEKVINETPNQAFAERLSFGMAQYYFRQDKYAQAIKHYETAGVNNLDNNEVSDQKFELAYCYFNNRQFDKAKPLFSAIKELKDSKYYMAGNYYYGLLCYNENKYDEALTSFDRVKEEREYRGIVPYYIAEIYYFKGNRQRALSLADTLIKRKEPTFYHKELHLLAAQCYFDEQKYAEAKPFFEYFYKHTEKIGKDDLYKMAYCYYRLGEWKNATEKFKLLSDARDSLGQTAMYLLGDCYLKTGNKTSARNAFGICADMGFNKGQQEAAMILYARLSYETGNNDEALRQLRALTDSFPNTSYRDEVKTLTSGLLIKTSDYAGAMKLLEEVKIKDKEYWNVYQKAAYGYGVQQYRKGELKVADEYFANSLNNPVNSEYERTAYFWRGEAAYHLQRYPEAISFSQNFISRTGDLELVEKLSPQSTIQHAYITMGYAAMETGNYVAAQDYFNQAQQAKAGDKQTTGTAVLLEADAVFLQKNYAKAIVLYEKVIAMGGSDADYAKYQKAILLGLQNKDAEKIALLQTLTKANPPSVYAGNARYEIALTYLEMDKYQLALSSLKQLTDTASDKVLAPKAWMKTGFIYQQLNDNNKAIDAYKRVVVNYPGADERFAALESLKSLYIQSNQPGLYAQLLKESNLPSADSSMLDSAYYASAESQFAASKWEYARLGFNDYLRLYPNGIFAVKAHYYLAESYYRLQRFSESLKEYKIVLASPWNDFSESSARRGAVMAMDTKDYEGAFGYYMSLRNNLTDNYSQELIFRGLMKSGHLAGRYQDAGKYADTLMALPNVSADAVNEGKFYKARTLQLSGANDEAIALYKQLGGNKNGEIAAESRYRIAEILVDQNKLKEAEEAASETVKLSAGYDTWVGKSYVLLADILVLQKDFFNAKALLQSIVKNTKNAELKTDAAKKLEEVKKLEKQQSKLSEE